MDLGSNTQVWLVLEPLPLVFISSSICLIFEVNCSRLVFSSMRSPSIRLMYSLVVLTSSTLTGASQRLTTIVYVALNFAILVSIFRAMSDTSSYHVCIVFRYSSSHVCNDCSSPWSFLFSPIFNILCKGSKSFIAVMTASKYTLCLLNLLADCHKVQNFLHHSQGCHCASQQL